MPIYNSTDSYYGDRADLVKRTFNDIVYTIEDARAFHECAVENEPFPIPRPRAVSHANIHLAGLFFEMTNEDGLTVDNVTVDNVKAIAERFSVNGNRYDIRGNDINEKNYKNVLFDISLKTSMALCGHPNAPRVGMLNAENEPLLISSEAFAPEPPAEVKEPKRPNAFKRFMNRAFGRYKESFDAYNADLKAYNEYKKELDAYDQRSELYEAHAKENEAMSKALKQAYDKENSADTASVRQHDHTFSDELSGKSLGTTAAVKDAPVLQKAMENY